MINKEVIILAGGFGTRLRSVVSDVPKTLAIVIDKPFLEYLIIFLKSNGVERFIFSLGYKSEYIINYITRKHPSLDVVFSLEESPLGTGGAIKAALKLSKNDFVLVVNGDTFFNFDLDNFYNKSIEFKYPFTMALLEIKENERYGSVEINEQMNVLKFVEKKKASNVLINTGFYIIDKTKISFSDLPNVFSLEKDFFENESIRDLLFASVEQGDFIDIGIPDDFKLAQTFFNTLKI